jgi:hypothetical protein
MNTNDLAVLFGALGVGGELMPADMVLGGLAIAILLGGIWMLAGGVSSMDKRD